MYTANITSTGNLIISFVYFRVKNILEDFSEVLNDLGCRWFCTENLNLGFGDAKQDIYMFIISACFLRIQNQTENVKHISRTYSK